MFFVKLVIQAQGEETHFSFATGQERVDVHLISTEDFKQIIKDESSGEWIGPEDFKIKKTSEFVTVRINITAKNIIFYKIKLLDYALAKNSFLSQIGGL